MPYAIKTRADIAAPKQLLRMTKENIMFVRDKLRSNEILNNT